VCIIMSKIKYINKISDVPQLTPEEVKTLEKVTKQFPFGANTYYLGLINWGDKADPIRRMIIPSVEEIEDSNWGAIDPSDEASYTVAPGLQHKYADTALFLLSNLCGGRCRYCFRKRLFMEHRDYEILKDYRPAIEYISHHKEINNILLTGGDPLRLRTSALEEVVSALRGIDHVGIIRIGTKMPVYDPFRVIDDPELPRLIKKFSNAQKRLYFMLHFSHPHEITKESTEAVDILVNSGAILCNQNPLLHGVNDNPDVLAELYKKLSYMGVSPYYTFQDRPALGNKPYAVPLVKGYEIIQEAKRKCSGTAKRAIFAMSHKLGKLEVVGLDNLHIYFRYHRAPKLTDVGKLVVALRNDEGYWFDDFELSPFVNLDFTVTLTLDKVSILSKSLSQENICLSRH
jgi:lysine 2,3-aminomutase